MAQPRMSGQPRTGVLVLYEFELFGLFNKTVLRAADDGLLFFGPRMGMPSTSACPPMEVRKPQDLLFFNSGFSFVSAIVR